jgi:hypothetical protein
VVPAVPVHVRRWPRGLARTAPWHTRSRHTKLQSTRCSARTHARTAVRHLATSLHPCDGASRRALPVELRHPDQVGSPS